MHHHDHSRKIFILSPVAVGVLQEQVALVAMGFVPCVFYLLWVRRSELSRREPFFRVFQVFALGATVSTGLALVLEIAGQFVVDLYAAVSKAPSGGNLLVGIVVLAPIFEEFTKAVPVLMIKGRSYFDEVEDGLVYGAAAGFGFAATENVMYFFVSWKEQTLALGQAATLASLAGLVIVRSLGSASLHGATGAISGSGISTQKLLGGFWITRYAMAVIYHALYNFAIFLFAVLGTRFLPGPLSVLPLVVACAFGLWLFKSILHEIRVLDRASMR